LSASRRSTTIDSIPASMADPSVVASWLLLRRVAARELK
jgi:hypothetical protein